VPNPTLASNDPGVKNYTFLMLVYRAKLLQTGSFCNVLTDVERLFLRYFSIPEKEGEGSFMSGTEIMSELEKHSHKTMAGVTANAFGRSMTRLGVKRVGHHENDGYIVLAA